MKRVAVICFVVLLSFVGPGLSQLSAGAQERQVRRGNGETEDAQENKADKSKAKRGTGEIRPTLCADCDPGDGGGGGGGGTGGDGHIWCAGWDRQGDCVFNHVNAVTSAEFRRQAGVNGYDWQTFLTWFPQEIDGFGRMPLADGNVGLVSTQPLPGQIPLHRWSTRKGFYYSIYFAEHGGDYVYGGIAAYVYPPGDPRGFPLYQFYSKEYGHFYTNYPSEITCRPRVFWDFQGEMARVNFPAPLAQALRVCSGSTLGPFPPNCAPFEVFRCQAQGRFWDFGSCQCF